MSTKEQIAATIEAAKSDLEQALQDLRQLPMLDWNAVRCASHTLGNYLNITSACIQLLGLALEHHPDPEVHGFLHSLERTTELMTFVTRHLTHASVLSEVPLLQEQVHLARMAHRASSYYQVAAENKHIQVFCEVDE